MEDRNHGVTPQQMQALIASRQSERQFSNQAVEPEKLARIIEAGRLAPSACNSQPWHFLVVDDPELRLQVADTMSSRTLGINHFAKQAPVHIVVVQEAANIPSKFGTYIKGTTYPPFDIGIAVGQMCLQAVAEGLGTCIVGWFNRKKVQDLLSIPSGKPVPLIIVLGYPTGKMREKKRKDFIQISSRNAYKQKNS